MARFLKDNDLNAELERLFENANKYLLLVSPYIKLHLRLNSILKEKKENPNLAIIIMFGKNENDYSKSIGKEDFLFFKDFPNIEIRHEKRLHAKYYENEDIAILTSMNLYSTSQDNNIESGVLINRKTILGSLTSNDRLDDDAYDYFDRVVKQSVLLFKREPQYESSLLGFAKTYINSEISEDRLTQFFNDKSANSNFKPTPNLSYTHQQKRTGYCIRTGVEIPFDIKHPLSDSAYQSWKRYGKKDFREKYCHYSGEESNGETTFANPVLKKNWQKSQQNNY